MTETSREYAVALFTLGKETGTEKEISESLDVVEQVFCDNPQYAEFLSSPGIPKKERVNCIKELFEGHLHEYALSFVCLLCERGRLREIKHYIEEYKGLHDLVAKVSKALVTSAVELSDKEKNELKEKLEKRCGHTVEMTYSVDKSIIGGVIVNIDGNVYDGSIKQQLSELKEVMYK